MKKASNYYDKDLNKNYSMDYLKASFSDFQDALYYFDSATNMNEWLVCLSAGKNLFGDGAKSTLESWSKQSSKFNKSNFHSSWKGAKKDNSFVISFFNKAKSYGWNPSNNGFQQPRPNKTTNTPQIDEKPKQSKYAIDQLLSRWNDAQPCNNHSYLDNKKVKPYNLKVNSQGLLLIPSYAHDGVLNGVQWINSKGEKQFYSGSDRTNASFHTIQGDSSKGRIFVEGYANGSKIHQATGRTIIVCFDAGMLPKVAKAIGKADDVVFADNDIRAKDSSILLDNFNSYGTGHRKAHISKLDFYLPVLRGADACDMSESEIIELLSKEPISKLPILDIYKINSNLHTSKRLDELFKAIEVEQDYKTICELCASIALKMTLQTPNVYRIIDIYGKLYDATVGRLNPIQLDKILERAFESLKDREAKALELVKVKSWGKHKVERIESLEGLKPEYKGVIIVNSPTGTKKTQYIGKEFINYAKRNNKTSMSLAHRISLIKDMCNRLEIDSYQDQKKQSVEGVDHLGICLHSLSKSMFSDFNNRVSHLFIDEVSQVIRAIADSNLKEKAKLVYLELRKIINEAECIVVCDASIDQTTLDFLEQCRPNEKFQVFEILPFNENKVATFYQDETELLNVIVLALAKNQKVWIATDSANWGESIINSDILRHCEKKILIDADSKKSNPDVQAFLANPDEESKKYDLVIASPTISSGVSINHSQFTMVAGYCCGKSVTATDFYQMLGRVRSAKEFHILVPNFAYQNIGEQSNITGIQKIYESENRTYEPTYYEKLHADIKHNDEQAKFSFASSLIWVLKQKKFTLKRPMLSNTIMEWQEIRKNEKAEYKKLMVSQLINSICLSDDEANDLESQPILDKDLIVAIKAFKIKKSLGYHYSHQLSESDLDLNPSDLMRLNALLGFTKAKNDTDLDVTIQKFNDERAKACQEIFKNLNADTTFNLADAQKIMAYIIQHRFRFARLGLVPKSYGRIYRNKSLKEYTPKFRMGFRQFHEILSRFGIKVIRTKESKFNDKKLLQLTNEVQNVSLLGFDLITNCQNETKSERINTYKIDFMHWEQVIEHARRLATVEMMKPLHLVQEIRNTIDLDVQFTPINDSPYEFYDYQDSYPDSHLEPIPIKHA